MGKWNKSKDDRVNSLKSGVSIFRIFSDNLTLDRTPKIESTTFERIKPIVLGFGPLSLKDSKESKDDRLNSPKSGISIFPIFSDNSTLDQTPKIESATFE